ncbi:TonB-dependent siderophore receptor [Aquitalea denitrificans]|uniref:TonB-dependent siderophore receptor n=1 Tax=Aquitalea denitrificans TaxID=519081 RepID=UPI001359B1EB|nr:TonB-dependent siderophore receptor [Aquitalea denitrificans]
MKPAHLLSTSLLILIPLTAKADDTATLETVSVSASTDSPPTHSYQTRETSVAGYAQSTLDTPQAVQSVSPQTIADKQVKTLTEAVGTVSGVVESNTLAGIQDSFTRRGFGERNDGSILRDGVRSYLMSNFDATTESVEVLKGPASLLYGIQEPGGVINVISKKPENSPKTTLSAQSSSFGGGSATLDTTGPVGDSNFAYRLIADKQDTDYWRNYGSTKRSMIAPSLSWSDERNKLLLSYQYSDFSTPWDRGTVFYNGKPLNVARETRLGDTLDVAQGHTQAATASFSRLLGNQWSLDSRLAWNEISYSNYETRATAYNARTGVLTRRLDGNVVNNSTLAFSTKLQGELSILGQNHKPVIGLDITQSRELRSDTFRGSASTATQLNVNNPVYGVLSTANTTLSATQSDSRSSIDTQSLLLMDNWELSPQWRTTYGLRYQHYRQEDGVGRPYVVSDRSDGYTALPQFGLIYKLNPHWSLYGSYSESFVPNAASDGQSFEPERGVSHEAGLKLEQNGISATAAVFHIEKTNVVATDTDGIDKAMGKVRSQGVELDVSGEITRKLSLTLAWAYTDAVVTSDPVYAGKQLYNVPKHSGSINLAYDLGNDMFGNHWRIGGGTRYVGQRQGDAANSFQLPSYYVTDAFIAWQTRLRGQKLEIQANLKNVFDKTYYASGTGTTTSSSSGSVSTVRLGDPRELLVKASLTF